MKVVIINGSVRKGRQSIHVSRYLKKQFSESDNEVVLLDLADYNFPVMDERMRFLEEVSPAMKEFSSHMDEADVLILVSPEYNGSYSGALKNTLDYFKSEYERKVMGLVTVSSGKFGGVNAMHHLQSWAVHVKGIVSPYRLLIDFVEQNFHEPGETDNPAMKKAVETFRDQLLWLGRAVSSAGR